MVYAIVYLLILFLAGAAAGCLVNRIAGKKGMTKGRRLLLSIGAAFLVMISVSSAYMQTYYPADETALAAMKGNENVRVSRAGSDYLFDGPGEDAPDRIVGQYDYEKWYIAGHSLGGIAASSYCADHAGRITGLAVLASYPLKEIPESVKMLSIYGDLDGCLNIDSYEKNKSNWPKDSSEMIIKGGNHSGFGCYGLQRGDSEAAISADEQQDVTAKLLYSLTAGSADD